MMNQESINIQKVKALKEAFLKKSEKNESYSLRSFARDLDVSHSLLSLIFKGKRRISDAFSRKLLDSKFLSKETKEILLMGLKREPTPEENYKRLTISQSEMMSDWVHYAILSLLEIKGFEWDYEWISKRLGVDEDRIIIAMERLEELDVIGTKENGEYFQKPMKIVVDNEEAFDAGKSFNTGILNKAKVSMEECDFKHRDISSTTFTLNPKFIPYAISKIKQFRRSLSEELENMGDQSQVYTLSVQLFPLTKIEREQC